MKHNDNGRFAEEKTAEYLISEGFEIVDNNWKTPKCEVDIIAKKDNCIYFVEVKYRSNSEQGDGFEYITKSKLRQMAYCAETWVAQNKWQGEYCLSGSSVGGIDFEIEFIEQI